MSGCSGQPNTAHLAPAALGRNGKENPHGKQSIFVAFLPASNTLAQNCFPSTTDSHALDQWLDFSLLEKLGQRSSYGILE